MRHLPGDEKKFFPLTHAQKRIYYDEKKYPGTGWATQAFLVRYKEEVNLTLLARAIQKVIVQNEAFHLRVVEFEFEHEPSQYECRSIEIFTDYIDFSGPGSEHRLKDWLEKTTRKPFTFLDCDLFYFACIRYNEKEAGYYFKVHHIICDDWAAYFIIEEIDRMYNDLLSMKKQGSRQVKARRANPRYTRYITDEQAYLESAQAKTDREFWHRLLLPLPAEPNLSLKSGHPANIGAGRCLLVFPGNVSAMMQRFCKFYDVSLFNLVLSALAIYVSKATGLDDILIGSTYHNRLTCGQKKTVGMFLSTVPLRVKVDENISFRQLVQKTKDETGNNVKNHQKYPFDSLATELKEITGIDAGYLLNISLAEYNCFMHDAFFCERIFPYSLPQSLVIHVCATGICSAEIELEWKYQLETFSGADVKRIHRGLTNLFLNALPNPERKIPLLELLSPEEKKQILFDFNDTAVEYPKDKTIHELFEAQVDKTPHRIALVFNEEHLTYKELDKKANQLGNYLFSSKHIASEEAVGILMDKCMERIAAILGVLKAGGGYVPIDPGLPFERIKYMINDSRIGVLLSRPRYIGSLNRLQWDCAGLHTFLCVDSNDIYSEVEEEKNQLMNRELWNHVGRTAVDDITAGGWLSSYTDEPFSRLEMDEWADNGLKKLLPLLNKQMRVLEIGTASGLTMYRIAPLVGMYYGTDLSSVIIAKNRERIKRENHENIKLASVPAHRIDQIDEKDFDLIIINSVIQTFHGHNYLRQVIKKCIALMNETGWFFIGDIMDNDLKDDLVADLSDFKRKNEGKGYKTKTDFSSELFVSRMFFRDLRVEMPAIVNVECTPKIHTVENELTRFRYDALMTIDKIRGPKTAKTTKKKFQDGLNVLKTYGTVRPNHYGGPDKIAYMIYTSGSTGKPKGVVLEHRSLVNLCFWHNRYYGVRETDHATQYAGFSFDASVWELFPYLVKGAALHILSNDTKMDVEDLNDYFEAHNITVSFLPTQFCEQFMAKENRSLRNLLTGGDKLRRFIKRKYNLYNNYGPTENTVVTTSYPVIQFSGNIPIGKPVDNTRVYILNKHNRQLQPIGLPGELCIAGANLARGYIGSSELTAEKFIVNPHIPGETMYCTGDLARWLPDGNIEFLGRIDTQVKIRGFRIETGEIEKQLLHQQEIKEAVVIVREENPDDRYLCAYFVSPVMVDILDVRNALSKNLPTYMIPSFFMQIDKIPLNLSGKVDRKSLPDPRAGGVGSGYPPPENEIEAKLVDIWADILNLEKNMIGIDNNFFDSGGHSLKAAVMIAKIHKVLDVKVQIANIFKMPTVRKLAEYIKGIKKDKYAAIEPAEKKEYYPQSSAQKRLFVLQQMDKKNTSYNILRVEMPKQMIPRQKLEVVFRELIQRHESFRTSFFMKEGEAVQRIHETVSFEIQCFETTEGRTPDGSRRRSAGDEEWEEGNRRKAARDRRLNDIEYVPPEGKSKPPDTPAQDIINSFVRPFDLGKPPLLRIGLITVRGVRQILVIDVHHIISDGVSIEELGREFKALVSDEQLPPLKLQYKDYSEWKNCKEERDAIKEQENYWLKEFEGEIPQLNLPTDFPRPPMLSFEGSILNFIIANETTRRLKKLANRQGATLYMVLLAAFNVLLAKLSGQEEILVGIVTAGRKHVDLQQIIGMFANTLVLKNSPSGEKTFKEFLAEVKERTLSAFENQDFQFEDLVNKVATRRDPSRNPLFDVSFGFWNLTAQTGQLLEAEDSDESEPYNSDVEASRFDISLMGVETREYLRFMLEFNTRLFKAETVKRFIKYFKKITSCVPDFYDRRIAAMEMIPEQEKDRILYDFNDNEADYPRRSAVHRIFEEQTARTGDGIAAVSSVTLTYLVLNKKADQLARRLIALGMKPGDPAAILVEPSLEMLIGMMGILKAGGAFLPIKDGSPPDRIKYMLEDSAARFLLTSEKLAAEMKGFNYPGKILLLDDPLIYRRPHGSRTNPPKMIKSCNPAYIIYTSGSTGVPKGVVVEHRSLVNLCFWHNTYYGVTSHDHASKYAGFGFDASVWETFPYLLSGASLYIVPEEIKLDIARLNRWFETRHITVAFLPTQMCEQFMTVHNTSLRVLLTGGDKLRTYTKRSYRLYNNYGPTENTVVTTSYPVRSIAVNIPIGKPVSNNQIYILDKNDNLQSIGVPGELCIGGDGVACGYLNRPELTAEKFNRISGTLNYSPLSSTPVYRTGDLARWLPDGNIEFLGRMDTQVKIRGFRIELGEIEAHLGDLEFVRDAVVIDRDSPTGEKFLCAYIVSSHPIDVEYLKTTLAKHLPDYMIPAYFIEIDFVPLTPSGKVDRNALPDPKTWIAGREYEAPQTDREKLLTDIWQQVLAIGKIGITDDFFHLGGDSIKAIQIVSRLHKHRLKLELNLLFRYRTVKQTAKHLKSIDADRKAGQGIVTGPVELTPIQRWFFANHSAYCSHFNQSVMLFRREGFDERAVRNTFEKILVHHDALRMGYDVDGSRAVQENRGLEGKLFDFEVIPVPAAEEGKETARVQRSMDLENGPLVKLLLFKDKSLYHREHDDNIRNADNENRGDRLLIIIHHLVIDGVSWRILLEDFETGYRQALEDHEIVFQDKTDSFQHWAQKVVQYSQNKQLIKQIPFWLEMENTPVESLPMDYESAVPEQKHKDMDSVTMVLEEKETSILLKKVNHAYNTEINDILLAALGLAVNRWAGIQKILINLEGHGREKLVDDADINRTVGWFTSQYPVLLDMSNPGDISFVIRNVKETLRRIPAKGIGYGILEYITPADKKESLRFALKPQIAFNYLGRFNRHRPPLADEISGISDPANNDSISPEFNRGHLIDITGITSDGILELFFSYNKLNYRQDSIRELVEIYKWYLLQIIDHCLLIKKTEPTPSDLGYTGIPIAVFDRIVGDIKERMGRDVKIEAVYPLTSMQKEMFYDTLRNKQAYFVQNVLAVDALEKTDVLAESIRFLIQRYDAARTIFVVDEAGEPLQIVLGKSELKMEVKDISYLSSVEKQRVLEEFKREDKQRGFDITGDSLMRIVLFKTDEDYDKLVWSQHHILMDGWCIPIIMEDLGRIYADLRKGRPVKLDPVPPFRTYVDWLGRQDIEEGLAYWNKYLEGYSAKTTLSCLGSVVTDGRFQAEDYYFTIGDELRDGLTRTAAENRVTLNVLFQTLWGILLQKYTGSSDVLLGAIVSGRPPFIPGIERMVGLFINIVPVRLKTGKNKNIPGLLKDMQRRSIMSKPYETLPLTGIFADSDLKPGTIDNIMFFENYPGHEEMDTRLKIRLLENYEQIDYNFSFYVVPGAVLTVRFSYNSLVFDREFIKRIALDFKTLAAQVVETTSLEIGELMTAGKKT